MSDYKIVASDLDGTLLDSCGQVSEENKTAIKELSNLRIEFVPATGRTISEIPEDLMKNPYIRYYIYSNGAGVYDKVTDKHILLCMPKEVSQKVLDIVCSYDTHMTFRQNGECYADFNQQSDDDYHRYNVWKLHSKVIKSHANLIENFTNFCRTLDNIEVFTVFFTNKTDLVECKCRLLETNNVYIMDSFPNGMGIEICSINSGKGKALKALADELNLDISQTIAIGDSDNDQAMIDTAGLSLAPSNSRQSIIDSADYVICSNDEHVVKYILENYIK